MQAKTEENTVATLEEERERLEEQAGAARRSIRDAEQRLQAIDARTTAIAARSFGGDEEAQQEVEDLEEETVRVTRSLKVARAAAGDFERMLEEVRERLRKAEIQVHRERYDALIAEGDALTPKIEELATELNELLEKRGALYSDASQELRYYDGDGANTVAMGIRPEVQAFVDRTFYQWLH